MAESKILKYPSYIVHTQVVIHDGEASGAQDIRDPDSISGYKPIGIIGYAENTSALVYYYNMVIRPSNGKLDVAWRTVDGSKVLNHSVTAYILYERI